MVDPDVPVWFGCVWTYRVAVTGAGGTGALPSRQCPAVATVAAPAAFHPVKPVEQIAMEDPPTGRYHPEPLTRSS